MGKRGTTPPAQMVSEVPKENEGVILGFTVTVRVVVVAHWPAEGVKVYVAECWLSTTAGAHVPVMPLVERFGSAGTARPAQPVSDVPKANAGITFGFTVTLIVTGMPHWPALGVKV